MRPAVPRPPAPARRLRTALLALLVAAGVAALVAHRAGQATPRGAAPTPAGAGFAAPGACVGCHEAEARAWRGSDHERAMDVATEATVLGDFDGRTLDVHGVPWRFLRRDGTFAVETEGPSGAVEAYEVRYVFGVRPLQQVLVDVGRGHLQALTTAWDVAGRRWFPLYDESLRPGDPLHWTGPLNNWNFMCAECHSTNLRRGHDPATGAYRTTWSSIQVACEACHGPGAAHVAWARRREREGAGAPAPGEPMDLAVRMKGAGPAVEIDVCARCHARRTHVTGDYDPAVPFLDQYDPSLLEPPQYHADGQIRDEVYEYGSFLQARKHLQGVRCSDCHDPHSLRLRHEGDSMCAQCHQPDPPTRFPTLFERAKDYRVRDHHHHEPGKPGSACVDCHMPATTYMVVDPRRDHSFRVPRPDLTVAIGTPNACDRCHADKGAAWSAARVREWFPRGRAAAEPAPFAVAFAAADAGDPAAAPGLLAVLSDPSAAPIVRASALARLERHPRPQVLDVVRAALEDPHPLVRAAAVRALAALVPRDAPADAEALKAAALASRLADPSRLVRVEAGRVATELPRDAFPAAIRPALDAALAEHVARQESLRDRPDGWLNLGVTWENLGREAEAEGSYREAIRRFPGFSAPASLNLAQLLHRRGRSAEAAEVLRAVPEVAGGLFGEAQYSLGLLLAETGRTAEAVEALQRAAALLPRSRVHYNLGLALRALGRPAGAEAALRRAHELDGRDPDAVQALVALYLAQGTPDLAVPWAERLVLLTGGDPGALRLLEEARRGGARR